MATAAGQFAYHPGPVGRWLDRRFPVRAARNREAALRNYLFDRAVTTRGFRAAVSNFAKSYDILGGDRTRKGLVKTLTGTGDSHLDEQALSDLRETARDAARNDSIVSGLLESYAEGIVGTELRVECRSGDSRWNEAREALWRQRMVEQPCEITGRFNFPQAVFLAVLSFARDGDFFIVFKDDGVWLVEGEQVGTPHGVTAGERFDVTNGVATVKGNGRVLGYYIGRPDKWGFIRSTAYTKYTADRVHHVWDPSRISYSRGEPLLTASIQWFDKFARYGDAELVTAVVQACQGVFIAKKAPESMLPSPASLTANSDSSVNTDDDLKRFKMSPGMVWEGDPGDTVTNIGATRPTSVFGEFMGKCLTIAGRAAGMPLMLITQDLSGATFMNARIAMQMAQERWLKVQTYVVKPLASRWWLWQTQRDIDSGELAPAPADWTRHEVVCRRWPYVNPQQEAIADEKNLANGTTTRTRICARGGVDFRDLVKEKVRESEIETEEGIPPTKPEEPDTKKEESDGDSDGE